MLIFLSIFYLFLPIRMTFMFNLSNSLTKAHPIPSVNPVIAIQQSPYFYLRSWAEDLDWLILCLRKMLAKTYNFLKYNAVDTVIAVAPAKKRSFCQFWEIEFRNKESKWTERSDKIGTLDMTVLNNLRTGFLSKNVYNNPITSFCYVAIRYLFIYFYMIDFV